MTIRRRRNTRVSGAGFLILLVASFPMSAQPPPTVVTPAAQTQKNEHNDVHRDAESAQAADHAQSGQDHSGPEWWLVYLSGFLVAVTAILAYYTARLWQAALRAAEDANAVARRQAGEVQQSLATAQESALAAKRTAEMAEKTLVASNRAWVKVDVAPGGPIQYVQGSVIFPFKYILKNIGRSPALHVWTNPMITLMSPGGPTAVDELRKMIDRFKTKKTLASDFAMGFTLFPDDSVTIPIIVSAQQDDLRRAKEAFGSLGAIYPELIGVVTYFTGLDESVHQTSFSLQVRRSDVPRAFTIAGNKSPSCIWIEEGDVPESEIRFVRSPVTESHAD